MKVFIISALLALLMFYPLAIIWALNYLFQLQIPYSFFSWLAIIVVSSIFTVKVSKN